MSDVASKARTLSGQFEPDQSAQTTAPVLTSRALILDCVAIEAVSLDVIVTEPTTLTLESVKSCGKGALRGMSK